MLLSSGFNDVYIAKIISNFPKSYQYMKEYMDKRFQERIQSDKAKELFIATLEIISDARIMLLYGDVRSLYDFFDSHEINVSVDFATEDPNAKIWDVRSNTIITPELLPLELSSKRVIYELSAFYAAFELLEKKR